MNHWRYREPRKSVRISVRVRTDSGWIDATVRNVSPRGLMLHSHNPLQRNEFVEIARGRNRVIGRVVWNDGPACGLRAQDPVDLAGLLAPSQAASRPREDDRRAAARPVPRFAAATTEERYRAARLTGRAFETIALLAVIASGAAFAIGSALEAASSPVDRMLLALGPASR